MSRVLKNAFPRNVTLEKSDDGYSLISEADPHDYLEDVYLNIYDKNQDLLIQSKNSDGSLVGGNFTEIDGSEDKLKDFIKWSSQVPYNFTKNSIQVTINPSLVSTNSNNNTPEFTIDTVDFFQHIEDDDARTTTIVLPLDRIKIQDTNEFIECGINLWVNNEMLSYGGAANRSVFLNMSTSELNYFKIQSFYVRSSNGIRIVSNGSCDCSLTIHLGRYFRSPNQQHFYISEIHKMKFSGIKIDYKQTLYDLNMELKEPWSKQTNTKYFEWMAYKYGISKEYQLSSISFERWKYTTDMLQSTYEITPVASIANFSEYFNSGSTVYWSIDTQSRNYDVFKASVFIESKLTTLPTEPSTATASYYVTLNGDGLETGDAIDGKYIIELKEESKYYYEHKIAEVKKIISGSNYKYTLSFKEQIPEISPEYYEVIINGESLEIDTASTSSIDTKPIQIDLLGEGVLEAQVAIILYTPKTYFQLIDENVSKTTLLGKTMPVYSKILIGEINAFKIEEDVSPIIDIKYKTESGEIFITEESSTFNLLWYNITIFSEDNTPIFKSSKIFSPLLQWKSNIPLEKGQQYSIQLEYQLKSGILKQETKYLKVAEDQFRTLTLPLNSGEEISFESFIEIYRFQKVSESSVSDLLNLSLKITTDASKSKKIYTSTYYTVEDDEINKILTFYSNNQDAASYSEKYSSYIETETEIIYKKNVEDLKTVVRIDENQKIHLLSQSLKKGRLKDHGLSLREKYQYSSPVSNSVLELSMTWGTYITGKAIIYKNKLFIYDLQSSLSGSLLNKSFQIIAGKLVIEETHFELNSLTFSILSVNFEIPPVDYIPVCLYGNVEKDENYNIYQVDSENIWYFDLDTKAESIDFTNEHTISTTLDMLPKVNISNMNYMTQTITTKLGRLNEEDMYVDDNGEKLNKFIDLMNSNSIKILRLGNGYLIPVDIQLKSNVSNASVVDRPSDITFSWTQVGDHRNISLYEEVI